MFVTFNQNYEQPGIANHLDIKLSEINTIIKKIEQEIAFIKEYRESIITAAVTGQLNVTETQIQMN